MRRTTYTNWISKILKEIANRRGDRMIENPAVQFTLDAKAGEYDEVSDETYNFLLNEVEELSKFWCDQKEVPAVQVLGAIFRKMNLDQKTIGAVAERLADRYAEAVKPFTEKNIVQDEGDLDWLFDMETEKKIRGFLQKKFTSSFRIAFMVRTEL